MEKSNKQRVPFKRKVLALALIGILGLAYAQIVLPPSNVSHAADVTDEINLSLFAYTRAKGYTK